MQIEAFLEAAAHKVILDVRSPSEFLKGHIIGAKSFPLFSDDERARIGTTYKQIGQQEAIALGYEIVNPKIDELLSKAEEIAPSKEVLIHCWRGGLRSSSVADLLEENGFHTTLLDGGYKSYRKWVKEILHQEYEFIVLGGFTGCSKTEILHELGKMGEQIIDLEGLANHRGSSFGGMMDIQPSTESFENQLAKNLSEMDPKQCIWIEDESIHIGSCWLDKVFHQNLRNSPLLILDKAIDERVKHILSLYGVKEIEYLKSSFKRIEKRLGGLRLKEAIESLETGDLERAALIALQYYDKSYFFGMQKRSKHNRWQMNIVEMSDVEAAHAIIHWKKEAYDRRQISIDSI